MRVAFLSVFAFDANISLINALKKNCEITFFTEALYEIYNYIDKNKLNKFISTGNDVDQIERFKDLIPLDQTFVIKGTRNSNIFKKIYNSYRIDSLLKKNNPDVIIIDNITLTYIWSAIRLRKKALLIVHDPFQHSGEEFFIQKYLRIFFFKLINNKILLNNAQKDRFVEQYNQKKENLFTSFLSVYTFLTYYHPNNLNQNESGKFNILFFGRISPYKGIKFLLETFVEILSAGQYKNITLTIAGSGDFDFDISTYKKQPNIKIINKFVSPEELALLISKSSVVVCPYTDATQSGVVMSAFAFKKPVIATDVGGLPEMVSHLKTGLIIKRNSKKELQEAIISLYNDPLLLKNMIKNIENEYFYGAKSWDQSGKLFFKALQSIYKNNQ